MRGLLIAMLVTTGCSAGGGGGGGGGGLGGGLRCTPGEQRACACVGGGQGAQVCAADGQSFGVCECPGDMAVELPDLAPAPRDLTPPPDMAHCGSIGEPCCNLVCGLSNIADGGVCQGTCGTDVYGQPSDCREINRVPTCSPCGKANQRCCNGSTCYGWQCGGQGPTVNWTCQ